MAPMTNAWILRILSPQSRPMHIDVDVVIVDHDPFGAKVHGNVVERFEIVLSFLS